jgi:hypothetical protein
LKPYESDSDDEDYNVDFDETKLPPIEIPLGDHKLQVRIFLFVGLSQHFTCMLFFCHMCSTAIISGTREKEVIELLSIRNLFTSSEDVPQLSNGGLYTVIS